MILHFFEEIVVFGTDKSLGICAVACVGQETMLDMLPCKSFGDHRLSEHSHETFDFRRILEAKKTPKSQPIISDEFLALLGGAIKRMGT
jgi:hypothetical protein